MPGRIDAALRPAAGSDAAGGAGSATGRGSSTSGLTGRKTPKTFALREADLLIEQIAQDIVGVWMPVRQIDAAPPEPAAPRRRREMSP